MMPGDSHGIICFVGIGSNVSDPAEQSLKAFDHVSGTDGVKFLRRSSLYKTEPVGSPDQEWFINAVAEIRTTLTARELLASLQAIENRMGRIRNGKWGPRTIDLDILLYGQEVIQEKDLYIPHPELHKRRFVLEPLCEIAPYVIHPAFGVSIRGLMDRLEDKSIVNMYRTVEY
jgi:2-amino-4-hydroxy-6-hydroxymethyldihydropteridine diphosphokinase